MPGFNLKSIRQVASAKIQVKDPATGDPTGVIFEMAGPEHPDRKRITFAQSRKFLRSYAKTGRAEMPEPEDAESQKKENLAAFTLGWTGLIDDAGAPVVFSKAAALELYNNPEMGWLVDQLDSALGEKELFITRSAKA
jgi:hypothetical protein